MSGVTHADLNNRPEHGSIQPALGPAVAELRAGLFAYADGEHVVEGGVKALAATFGRALLLHRLAVQKLDLTSGVLCYSGGPCTQDMLSWTTIEEAAKGITEQQLQVRQCSAGCCVCKTFMTVPMCAGHPGWFGWRATADPNAGSGTV